MFSSKETAEIAYDEWENEWFLDGWQPRAEAVFIPDDLQDQYRYACIDVIANGKPKYPCTFLQQHNRFVSLVLIGIDGESITFDEFNQLLQVLDDKLNAFEKCIHFLNDSHWRAIDCPSPVGPGANG